MPHKIIASAPKAVETAVGKLNFIDRQVARLVKMNDITKHFGLEAALRSKPSRNLYKRTLEFMMP